jgi:hypothetical protein
MSSSGLQTVINYSNTMLVDRRKVVGIQYTRNEVPRATQTPTLNPWKFTFELPNSFRYSDARALMEEVDTLDAFTPQLVTFSNNSKLAWIFAYQGTMSPTQISAITVLSYAGNQLILNNIPPIGATRLLFAKNDLIQIAGYPYPFTSTTDVYRGTGPTVTITTSRPNIISTSVVGNGIVVGNGCQFNVFCPNMPKYKLTVGGQLMQNGQLINNALLNWSSGFLMYEYVSQA